ncbi:hypothetical protein HOH87_00480 [bacterium]|nr:hypothetical protein [bacterium]
MDLFNEINAQIAVLPKAVGLWVNWMAVIFVSGIFFAKKHKTAKVTVLAFIVTLALGTTIFAFIKNVHILGIAHLIVWIPLFLYLKKNGLKEAINNLTSAYNVWLVLVSGTIIISLIFDVRDVILVFTGAK